MNNQPQKTLSVQNLSASINSGKILVNHASFSVRTGEIVGLIGPNGAGKTSLLRSVCGLIPLDAGTIELDQQNLLDIEAGERAKKIAYLAQGNQLHWPMQVEKLISLGRAPHLSSLRHLQDTDETAIAKAMKITETTHLAERTATSLSGGERALVLLARALVVGADFLFADEPTASLDPYHQLHVMELLRSLCNQQQGVLVTLHDLSLAERFCDRLIMMHEGEIVADGSPSEVLNDRILKQTFNIGISRWQDGDNSYIVPTKR